MSQTAPEPLAVVLGGMQQAGLDISVSGLLDAFWLALQPGFKLTVAPAATAGTRAEVPPGDGTSQTEKDTRSPVRDAPSPPGAGTPEAREVKKPLEEREENKKAGIFGAGAGEDETQTRPASPLRIPAGAALACKLPLARSLRPLRQMLKNPRIMDLDEEATADATAEAGGIVIPVLRPRTERWYELVIVTDAVPSMDVWFETMLEFEQLSRTAGAFRDVRHSRLKWKPSAQPGALPEHPEPVLLNSNEVPVPAATLAHTNVRRLIFVATNGTAEHWSDGRMTALLTLWSKQCSVVILQMLPERFWHQVRLGEPELLLTTLSPGTPTAALDASSGWWDDELKDAAGNLVRRIAAAVPVLPLDPLWMGRWARMQMGGGQPVPGVVIRRRDKKVSRPRSTKTNPEDWQRAVDTFTRNCTPEARNLAVYLAQGTFTLPVARLVQTAALGEAASQTQLAEILLSGLVQRTTDPTASNSREWVEYRFHPQAATILTRGLRESDARDIAHALEEHIERYWGKPVDFRALVHDPAGLSAIPAWAQPFAQLGRALVNLLPGARTPAEMVKDFKETLPAVVFGFAARMAHLLGQAPLDCERHELWPRLLSSGLLRRNRLDQWQILPELQPLLAELAEGDPLIGIEILWVERNPDDFNYWPSTMLRGASVSESYNTDEALARVRGGRFDIIISDMRRASDNQEGLNLLAGLKKLGVKTPVIMLAARSAETGCADAIRAGAFACTYDVDEVFNYVSKVAYLLSSRMVPAQVEAVLRRIDFGDRRIFELLQRWEDTPEEIANEILSRAANPSLAFRNCLEIIQAYAGSSVNQLYSYGNAQLERLADASDGGKGAHHTASLNGIIGSAIRSEQNIWIPDVSRGKGYFTVEPTSAAAFCVPLFVSVDQRKILVGAINIELPAVNSLDDHQRSWLSRFSAPLGAVIGAPPQKGSPSSLAVETDSPDAGPDTAAYRKASIFYATDRDNDDEKEIRFGTRRAGRLSFGICGVTIPPAHRFGNVEDRSLARLQFRKDPEKHFTLAGIDPLPQESFEDHFSAIENEASESVLIYIHGYNYDFTQAAFRCAQIHWDVARDTIPVLYSWPSQGEVTGYLQDQATAEWTASHLRDAMAQLLKANPSRQFHLLAEGLGCRIVSSALLMLRSEMPNLTQLQVIFVRADLDAAVFRRDAAILSPLVRRFTLYTSTRDKSLDAAKIVARSSRAGSSVQVITGVDTIDVSSQDKGLVNAGFSEAMLMDIKSVIGDIPPQQRLRLRRATTVDGGYWVLDQGPDANREAF